MPQTVTASTLIPSIPTTGAEMGSLPKRPYPGLRPFAINEWEIFFGREIMTEDVIQRLLRHGLVLVHGSSGSGKSSLVYAGVLPQLERRRRRRKLTIKAGMMRPGRSPLRSLAAELARSCAAPNREPDVDGMHRILIRGRDAREEIEARIRETGPYELCIFIDQFEELFRFTREGDPEEARIFADVVVGLAGSQGADAASEPAYVPGEDGVGRLSNRIFAVLTMRSEFLGDCARFPGLAEAINRTQYLLPNMSRPDLLRAIREPAALYNGSVDWELAEQLARDAAYETDALPLIQHALMRLWERSSNKRLRLADYVAAASQEKDGDGQTVRTGMAYILAAHADEVLTSSLDRMDDARVVEYSFRALTDIDAEGRAIRRPQPFERLCRVTGSSENTLRPILDAFRPDGVSFLTPYAREGTTPLAAGDMIDVSHEALIRCWPRMSEQTIDSATGRPRGWLHQEFQDGLIWRSLAVQAQVFRTNPEACLDPATTEQRWPWFETARNRPAWALRYLIERSGLPVPEEEPEWQAVKRLMAASYERWQAEKNRTRSAELKAELALNRTAEAQTRTASLQRITRWALAAVAAVILIAGGILGWLQWDKARQLARQEAALVESRQQFEEARATVYAEQASNAALQESLNRRQVELDHAQANILAELSAAKLSRSDFDSALRLASLGTRIDLALPADKVRASAASAALAAAVSQANWRFILGGNTGPVSSAAFSPDGCASSPPQWTRPPGSGTPRAPRRSRSCAATTTQ